MSLEGNNSPPWGPLAEHYVAGANVTEMVEMASTWNWASSNKVVMTLQEKKNPSALQKKPEIVKDLVVVHVWIDHRQCMHLLMVSQARMEFTDQESQETLRLDLDGVHFVSQGSIVGLVEPFGLVLTFLYLTYSDIVVGGHLTSVYSPLLYLWIG